VTWLFMSKCLRNASKLMNRCTNLGSRPEPANLCSGFPNAQRFTRYFGLSGHRSLTHCWQPLHRAHYNYGVTAAQSVTEQEYSTCSIVLDQPGPKHNLERLEKSRRSLRCATHKELKQPILIYPAGRRVSWTGGEPIFGRL
jgi:hypothetical protein